MRGRYEYQRLVRSRREIRLLELLPINHRLSKFRPACRISHTTLDKAPSFLALSYVWGDENDIRYILVDKRPFRVRRNLFDAMMGLRETESVTIWIDAISMNQTDDEEKSWQVRLMGDIYQKASGVPAWLGASADNSDMVIDYLNRLGLKAEACGLQHTAEGCIQIWQAMMTTPSYMDDPAKIVWMSWLDERLLPVSKYVLERLLHSISGCKSQDQLVPTADLNRLFRRAWWGRVWVLQEITLPESAFFACGTKRISRRRFRAAFNAIDALWMILTSKRQQQQSLTVYQTEFLLMTSHRVRIMLSMSKVYRMQRFPLVALLRATCVESVHLLKQDGYQHLESTDPRDKIFALLGLARDQKELEALRVFPDYKKSKEEVYMTTMAALLKQGHTSMLSICRVSETLGNLPSWVPDWSVPSPHTLQDVKPDHLTLYPEFNASGSEHQNHVIISENDQEIGVISILASICDEVLQVGSVPRVPVTGTCKSPLQWLYEILRLTYDAKNIYADFNERLQAVVRASHAATGFGEDTEMKRVNRFFDALPIFKSGIQRIPRRDIKLHLRGFLDSKEARRLLKSGCGVPSRLDSDFMRLSSRRSPFVTEKGHLGLSSQYVRQGDIVTVIGGAQVPFILRRRDTGKYMIISEAYVDGIMDGEAAGIGEWGHIELV